MLPNPYVILGFVLVIIGAAVGGYFKGRHDMDLFYKAQALEAAQHVITQEQKSAQVTEQVGQKAEEKQVEIRTVTEQVIKWRTKYVTKIIHDRPVPVGVVRVLNAAASMQPLPDTSGESDALPSAVGLAAVTDSAAINYGKCNEAREQLIALQGWIKSQVALFSQNAHQ